jgi:hypothetical protein
VATARGGKDGLAPASWFIRQAKPLCRPGAPPVAHPVLVLAQLPPGTRVIPGGLGVQQQGQPGSINLGLRCRALPHQTRTDSDVLIREDGLVVRMWSRQVTSVSLVVATVMLSTLPQSLQTVLKGAT